MRGRIGPSQSDAHAFYLEQRQWSVTDGALSQAVTQRVGNRRRLGWQVTRERQFLDRLAVACSFHSKLNYINVPLGDPDQMRQKEIPTVAGRQRPR